MANPETTAYEKIAEGLKDAAEGNYIVRHPSQSRAISHDWVVSVRLGDVDGITADEWMDAIMEFVYTRDTGFSGVVVMQKEAVDA